MGLNKRQKAVFATIAIAHMCCGICIAIQAPFYPSVASAKGVSPTVFGLVFGVFQLTVFFMSPLCGQYMNKIGSKRMLIVGLFIMGLSAVLFGFIVFIDDMDTFIALSFIIRIVEAVGCAGYLTSSFSIATQEFSNCLATMISILEIFYGSGLAIGPTVGGALYDAGGFVTPFVVLGSVVLISAFITMALLPQTDTPGLETKSTIWDVLKKLPILLSLFTAVTASANVGYLEVTLEPHLRPFGMSHFEVGMLFLITGAAYAVSTPIWGRLADKGFHHRWMAIVGALLNIVAFFFIGPAPFFSFTATVWLVSISLIVQGLGFGAQMIASFTGGQKDAILSGFPEDLSTFGLVSGCWASAFAFGAFFGPTCAGALFDAFGFRTATMYVVGFNFLLALINLLYILYRNQADRSNELQIDVTEADKELEMAQMPLKGDYSMCKTDDC